MYTNPENLVKIGLVFVVKICRICQISMIHHISKHNLAS